MRNAAHSPDWVFVSGPAGMPSVFLEGRQAVAGAVVVIACIRKGAHAGRGRRARGDGKVASVSFDCEYMDTRRREQQSENAGAAENARIRARIGAGQGNSLARGMRGRSWDGGCSQHPHRFRRVSFPAQRVPSSALNTGRADHFNSTRSTEPRSTRSHSTRSAAGTRSGVHQCRRGIAPWKPFLCPRAPSWS